MLRCGKQIRLTPVELRTFQCLDGAVQAPKTVDEFNNALEADAQYWEADGTPEGKLMAAVARGEIVAE